MTLPDRLESNSGGVLSRLIAERTVNNTEYWDFEESPVRSGGHALFQYPAMMVPELQGALLDDLRAADPKARLVYDPFMGSGTVMLESLYRGLNFHGSDINPMAVLLCEVKSKPPSAKVAAAAIKKVVSDAEALASPSPVTFKNREKWFNPEVVEGLSKIRAAIQGQQSLRTRRFLWICMAETIRLVSNSRTSTFKLHSYSAEDLMNRKPDPLRTFATVGSANAARIAEHWKRFQDLPASESRPVVTLLRGAVSEKWTAPRKADALMTSPPYGDNRTTVPYGQHSYLPLQWIDHNDLVGTFDESYLSSTARIDSLSLGGSIVGADRHRQLLRDRSPSADEFLLLLDERPPLRKKVLSFVHDYSVALADSSERLRDGAFSFWTLGERRVGGCEMPLVAITRELLEDLGHSEVTTVTRKLPLSRKRMAGRNSTGVTMGTEQILIMQKSGERKPT